jgi:hypothetical protein
LRRRGGRVLSDDCEWSEAEDESKNDYFERWVIFHIDVRVGWEVIGCSHD